MFQKKKKTTKNCQHYFFTAEPLMEFENWIATKTNGAPGLILNGSEKVNQFICARASPNVIIRLPIDLLSYTNEQQRAEKRDKYGTRTRITRTQCVPRNYFVARVTRDVRSPQTKRTFVTKSHPCAGRWIRFLFLRPRRRLNVTGCRTRW